jgi:gamma-glutamyltranspeptidase/glutathione hydrolase
MLTTARGTRGVVTAPHRLAAEAGLEVLKEGGTAVEAAVATAAALVVLYPHMNSLGGDGFWLIAQPGRPPLGIESCGRAARSADLDLYRAHGLTSVPWRGPLAANTVAGMVAGWQEALTAVPDRRLPLKRLLEPAVAMARDGAPVARHLAANLALHAEELWTLPGFAETYLPGDKVPVEGDILKQPRLAATLERLAEAGLEDFYRGEIGHQIALDLAGLEAPVSELDIKEHQATRTNPLELRLGRDSLVNLPPPTQGFVSLLILGLFERLGMTGEGFDHVHGVVEATKLAFMIRDRHIGDPAYHKDFDPQGALNNDALLDHMARAIDRERAMAWPMPAPTGDTVWFGAMDELGRAASVIQSTYFAFGSGIVLPRTGIGWQNRGTSFRLAESGWNALKPGRKPFHTLNPAMALLSDGRLMAYGTMGGEGQPQTQAAVFTRYARFGQDLQEAISAPRWLLGKTSGPDTTTLKLEDRFDPAVVQRLREAGHEVETVAPFASMMGHAGALVRLPDGSFEGAADPRSDGAALAF